MYGTISPSQKKVPDLRIKHDLFPRAVPWSRQMSSVGSALPENKTLLHVIPAFS